MPAANLDAVASFVTAAADRPGTPALRDAAKQCFVDWFAVSLAAREDAGPMAARRLMRQWATRGEALSLYGDSGAAAPMAFVNATLSHSLDYDDMHFGTAYHASGPTVAAALAVGMDRGCSEAAILDAFVAGYEVGATLGGQGVGPRLAASGWHPTGVLGHFSAASTAATLLRLDAGQVAHAMGLAATQAAGLQASGGSMAKPFHVGKAAMNGIMAAQLAQLGMDAPTGLLDAPETGILGCLFQQPLAARLDTLGREWQIEGNTFKPYAACQLTHAPYEAARELAPSFDRAGLRQVRVHVNPLAKTVAGRESASTPMEGKFSIAYCVALGLHGLGADITGFSEDRLAHAGVQELVGRTTVMTSEAVERWAAVVELDYGDGGIRRGETTAVRGSPGRPLTWADLDDKFLQVTTPVLGAGPAQHLLEVLHRFERPGSLAEMRKVIAAAAIER